jgi:L-amino acid N-acyltransferase YncA
MQMRNRSSVIEVTPATTADIAAINDIHGVTIVHTYAHAELGSDVLASYVQSDVFLQRKTEYWQEAMQLAGCKMTIARSSQTVVGFLEMREDDAVVQSIYVHPDFQHRGIGSAMLRPYLDTATCWQRQMQVATSVEINQPTSNTLNFYRRHGFRPSGVPVSNILLQGVEIAQIHLIRQP